MAKRFHILHHIKPKLVLIGGGGHARACIDVIEQENHFRIYGIIIDLYYNVLHICYSNLMFKEFLCLMLIKKFMKF